MRLFISSLLACALASAASFTYHVAGDDAGSWPRILSSIGLSAASGGPTNLFVVRTGAPASTAQWIDRLEKGSLIVLEGDSELATALGFKQTTQHVTVRSTIDTHAPKLPIIWEKPLDLLRFDIPKDATIFVKERWEGAPLMAATRRGTGAVLWVAVSPGMQGYERFPYLLQALQDLGLQPPFESRRLWAFFDSAYRSRVDLDYFAERWRKAGIAALHVAGWHYFESSPESDQFLRNLIEACHRRGILVYAWLELPHVSEKFWADHPEWREQTATLQDAQLDWRKLMNLQNPDAVKAVREGTTALIDRFDWDGVNLAELYFESLEGAANPARFTPMNPDVRRDFKALQHFDPVELFQQPIPDAAKLRTFLDYRAELSRKLQTEWVGVIESARIRKPNLDLVLTHVDDRFDRRMRDLIGADASRVLPMLDQHDFTFLIEDPATVWNLGPQRYPEISKRYQPLTTKTGQLAIDINVVERYQDVYPTKQQTGTELFQEVHLASQAFPRIALYFENSILSNDLALLPAAAANVDKFEQDGVKLTIGSKFGVGVAWRGPALVNGRPWPVADQKWLWLPPGHQVVEPAHDPAPFHIVDFNGNLLTANSLPSALEFSYQSNSCAMAVLDSHPQRIEIDGGDAKPDITPFNATWVVRLPRGQHLVTLYFNKTFGSADIPGRSK